MAGEPTFQSVHGAMRAMPTPRPDRVVRLLFHSPDDVYRVMGGRLSKTSSPAAVFGIPVVIDKGVPADVCRQELADGTTNDLPL